MFRLPLDSNIYISALIFGGKPLQVLEMGLDLRAEIAISDEILHETLGVLQQRFRLSRERLAKVESYIKAATHRVLPSDAVDVVSDAPDNRILECAKGS